MKCPVCNVELKIYVRQAIEVDYCPQCRGVWLDRGKLDKIIEASLAENPATMAPAMPASAPINPALPVNAPPAYPQTNYPQTNYQQPNYQQPNYRHKDHDDDDDDDDDYRYRQQHGQQHGHDPRYDKYGKRKNRGVLGEIFDIFD